MKTLKLSYFEKLSENYGKDVGVELENYPSDYFLTLFRREEKLEIVEESKKIREILYKYCKSKYYCPNLQFVNSETYVEDLTKNFTHIHDIIFEKIEDKISILLQYTLLRLHLTDYIDIVDSVIGGDNPLYYVAKLENPIVISYLIDNVLYNLKINYLLKINIDKANFRTIEYILKENLLEDSQESIINHLIFILEMANGIWVFGGNFEINNLLYILKNKYNSSDYNIYLKGIFENEYIIYDNHTNIIKYSRY